MRILHTADWHLNDRLGRVDRTDDLRRAVERVADLCESERADVLLVAGDLFSELARPDALRDTIRHWQQTFGGFLARGGTVLTLTGNHDNESFCRTLQHAMTLATPPPARPGDCVAPGRLYLAAEPTYLRLADPAGGPDVQFVLMPYPTPGRYLGGEAGQRYGGPDEKNRLLVEAFSRTLDGFPLDPTMPAVLAAHAHVHGGTVGKHALFRLTEQEDVVLEGAGFAEKFCYVALGHIHKPQAVGFPNVRYSGSIEALDLGEKLDRKEVSVFDVGEGGLVGAIRSVPLESTKIYEVTLRNPSEELPLLREEYAGAENDLVSLHVHYTAGEDNLEEILRELDRIFPRWYARDWTESRKLIAGTLASEPTPGRSFVETVRDYLDQELVQHDEAERGELLRLADELAAECD